jgi:pyruvate dehydrogenase E2 component (dihydrolipoamide acetyltransferase)
MPVEFKLPELGENVEKGDIVRVLVKVGETVAVDQPVLELETDKATIEVPSSLAGTVTDVRVKVGDKVKVGQPVLVLDEAAGSKGDPKAAATPVAQGAPAAPAAAPTAASTPAPTASPAPAPVQAPPPTPAKAAPAAVVDIAAARPAAAARAEGGDLLPAAPSTRRYAREFGVELREVAGTGPGGRIGQADVKDHVKARLAGGSSGAVRLAAEPLPDFTKWGDVDVKPMSNIRRKTAEHLSAAWAAPHVTQHDRSDVTELEGFRTAYGARVEKAGGKLTVTAILLKVVAAALQKYPQFAASVDMAAGTIIYKKFCHVGVAVDTPNGLLVPVIRDVDRKTITELAVELAGISQRARDKKLTLEDMSGGVFTISNLGGIGGTAFTPIVNTPEVAILGVSRGSTEPVWRNGAFVPRQILPLSLSYDHRVIDGADGARFLRFIAEALEQPLSVFL